MFLEWYRPALLPDSISVNDDVLELQPSGVLAFVPGHQSAGRGHDAPPRELTIGIAKNAPNRPGRARISGFGRHFAIADHVARSKGEDHIAHRCLERREFVSHSSQPPFEPDELDRHLHAWDGVLTMGGQNRVDEQG